MEHPDGSWIRIRFRRKINRTEGLALHSHAGLSISEPAAKEQHMTRRVVVTGLGIVSPIGNDLETSWKAALAGVSGIDKVTRFDASILGSQIAGEVKDFDASKYLGVKEVRRFDRFVHLGVAAGIMALEDSGIEVTEAFAPEIGVAIGAGIGGIPLICANHDALNTRGPRRISPFMIPGSIINMTGGQLAIMKNLKGPNIAHVTACSTGLHAIGEAMHIIRRGDATAMIAGGCESTIHPLAMGAFDAMHALSRRNDDPKTSSRPFDKDRDGFVMGEGAGVLMLEELEHALARGAHIYAEVAGYGLSGDAYHITTPSTDGPARCMRMALRNAGMNPDDIDYLIGSLGRVVDALPFYYQVASNFEKFYLLSDDSQLIANFYSFHEQCQKTLNDFNHVFGSRRSYTDCSVHLQDMIVRYNVSFMLVLVNLALQYRPKRLQHLNETTTRAVEMELRDAESRMAAEAKIAARQHDASTAVVAVEPKAEPKADAKEDAKDEGRAKAERKLQEEKERQKQEKERRRGAYFKRKLGKERSRFKQILESFRSYATSSNTLTLVEVTLRQVDRLPPPVSFKSLIVLVLLILVAIGAVYLNAWLV